MDANVASVEDRRNFRIDNFEGPLDLLLHLIRKNEVNIYDIPIAQITEQYLDCLRFAETLNLDEVSEFQAMAATLLYIKSRMLLPVEIEGSDEEDPRQFLVERLIEYQKYKKLSLLMEDMGKESEWIFERQKLQQMLPFSGSDMWEQVDIWDLLKTFSTLIRNVPGESIIDMYEEITINEKVTLISELLENKGECTFTDLIIRSGSIMDIVCAFLAVLEAVKVRMIMILQNRMFGDILIRPHTGVTHD